MFIAVWFVFPGCFFIWEDPGELIKTASVRIPSRAVCKSSMNHLIDYTAKRSDHDDDEHGDNHLYVCMIEIHVFTVTVLKLPAFSKNQFLCVYAVFCRTKKGRF